MCVRYLYGGVFKSCVYPGMLRSMSFFGARMVLTSRTLEWLYYNPTWKNSEKNPEHGLPDWDFGETPYSLGVLGALLIIFIFAIILLIPACFAASRITNVQERQQEYEADFKHQHQLICDNSESIAVSDGSGTESSMLSRRFQPIYRNILLFLNRKIWLDLAQKAAMPYGPSIIALFPATFCAIAIANDNATRSYGEVDVVLQADLIRRFFVQTCELLGFLICSLHIFAQSSAFAKRVMKALELQEEFLLCEAKLDPDGIELLQQTGMNNGAACCGLELRESGRHVFGFQDIVRPSPDDKIRLRHADIYTPVGDRLLLHDVNLELHPGDTCLLVGPSGTGKSSLIRVLGRIWPLFKAKEPRHTEFTRPDHRNNFTHTTLLPA